MNKIVNTLHMISALTCFHAGLLTWSNWNLKTLGFVERGKTGEPGDKPSEEARTNNKLNPQMTPSRNRTRAILVVDKRSYYCDFLLLGCVLRLDLQPKFSPVPAALSWVKESSFFQENKKLFTTVDELWHNVWDHWERSKLPTGF